MKFLLPSITLVTIGALAAPVQDTPSVAKRAADVFADSIQTSGGVVERSPETDFSNSPHGAEFAAKRSVEELAHLLALTHDDPADYFNALDLPSHFNDDTQVEEEGDKTKCSTDAIERRWCRRKGMGCWKSKVKRDAETIDKRWCRRKGMGCWKAKRAADAVLEAVGNQGGDDDLATIRSVARSITNME